MEHKEGEGVSVGLRHLGDCLEELGHPVRHVRVGGGLGEHGPLAVGDQRLSQRLEEVLDQAGEGVHVALGEIGTPSSSEKLLTQVSHLFLTSRDPVEADFREAPGLDLVDAVDNEGRDHGGGVGRVVSQLPAPGHRRLAGGLLSRAGGDTGQGDLEHGHMSNDALMQ